MRIQDNLDSNIEWYKVLNNSGQFFGSINANISQIINGHLSRNAYYSEYYGIIELFRFFPPVIAYGLNKAITRFVALLGMYLLLNCCFFLHFHVGFFFFLSAMGVFWLIDVIKTKKAQLRLFFSIFYMTLIYLAIEYREVVSLIFSHKKTNRYEFYESKNNFIETIRLIFKNYFSGHNQDKTSYQYVIFPAALLALIIVIFQKRWRQEKLFIGLVCWVSVIIGNRGHWRIYW